MNHPPVNAPFQPKSKINLQAVSPTTLLQLFVVGEDDDSLREAESFSGLHHCHLHFDAAIPRVGHRLTLAARQVFDEYGDNPSPVWVHQHQMFLRRKAKDKGPHFR